ncbi:site-specific integrase [Streptomyces jumonjinensis]|uniref:Site-specific integrase n=1 Tax=Streptomyces jumonjinensis TaxID=1945 RepID=A0A646KAX3_STRJU|nr:site-specific integrase [Streptomyces jumonjinensis]
MRWRSAGGGRGAKEDTENFRDERSAEKFRDLVNAHGQSWPPGWIRGQGFIADQRRPGTMFEPYALAHIDRLTGVQGDTKAKYRKLVLENMSPWFKPYTVEDGEGSIVREMVQDWINDLAAGNAAPLDPSDRKPRKKYAAKTIANQHGLLSAILQAAVDAVPSLRTANPCAKNRLPRLDTDEVEDEICPLEREEWAWVHECLGELDTEAQELGEVIAETGFRWGESTALQPRDLQMRNGRPALRVQRAWKRDEDGQPYLGAPKSKKSRRTVVVRWGLWNKLKRRAKGLKPTDLLFTGPMGGRWDAGTFRRLRWVPAIELAAERFGLTKRPRIHDLRHSHAAWLIAAKVPLPAIQARLGHESITTTIDVYGHLLDALDDEVVAAVEWAMDPMAPLPGFLVHSGLAQLPHQRGWVAPGGWTDPGGTPGAPGDSETVFVITAGSRRVPFAERQHAQDVADQWNNDRAETITKLKEAGWTEDGLNRVRALGPEERERWTGAGPVWRRKPDRRLVYHRVATFRPDGTLAHEPEPMADGWVWEFETDLYTDAAAQMRTEFRPGPSALTEAFARGIDKEAVSRAYDEVCAKAQEVCGHSPYLEPLITGA